MSTTAPQPRRGGAVLERTTFEAEDRGGRLLDEGSGDDSDAAAEPIEVCRRPVPNCFALSRILDPPQD